MEEWGLDFAMSATFIGIVVPYLKNRPMIAAAIVASGLGLALHGLPNKLGLMIAALAGVEGTYSDSCTSQLEQLPIGVVGPTGLWDVLAFQEIEKCDKVWFPMHPCSLFVFLEY